MTDEEHTRVTVTTERLDRLEARMAKLEALAAQATAMLAAWQDTKLGRQIARLLK